MAVKPSPILPEERHMNNDNANQDYNYSQDTPSAHVSSRPSRRSESATASSFYSPDQVTPKTAHFTDDKIESEPESSSSRNQRVETFNTVQSKGSSNYEKPWGPQYVLSLDGGGVRGYSSLLILKELMSIIERIEKSHERPAESSLHPEALPLITNGPTSNGEIATAVSSKFFPCHYFDYAFGTSTGGLIAIMLGRLRMNVDDCLQSYEDLAADVFRKRRKICMRSPLFWPRGAYSHKRLEAAVKNVVEEQIAKMTSGISRAHELPLGRGVFESYSKMCKTGCLAYAKNVNGDEVPYIFRSWDHLPSMPPIVFERNPGRAHTIPIWQVACATCAAPTYFDTMEILDRRFGDGGFGCNNPSLEAYNEVMFMNSERDDAVALLLSVGTGRSRISRYGTGKRASIYAYFKAAKKLASDSEGTHENMSAFSRRGEGFPYYRFNVPDGLSEIKLDDAKRSTLRRMREETEKYIELGVMDDGRTLVRDHLEEVATKLVESRRERAETPQWEMIALGIRYHCPIKACSSGHKIKDTKADLWDHLVTKHGKPRRGVETEQEKGEIEDIIQRGRIEPSLGIAG